MPPRRTGITSSVEVSTSGEVGSVDINISKARERLKAELYGDLSLVYIYKQIHINYIIPISVHKLCTNGMMDGFQ